MGLLFTKGPEFLSQQAVLIFAGARAVTAGGTINRYGWFQVNLSVKMTTIHSKTMQFLSLLIYLH